MSALTHSFTHSFINGSDAHSHIDLQRFVVYHVYCLPNRYAKYNTVNGVEERTLYKAFGIRFDVMVFGQVGLIFLPPF